MLNRFLLFLLIPYACLFANDTFLNTIKGLVESFIQDLEDDEEIDVVSTQHSIDITSGSMNYTAVAGVLPQYYQGNKVGELFFTAYLKDTEQTDRPVTFIFSGGPGGSCASMHIGGLGPKRLLLPEEGQKVHPPYQLIDNPETMLVHSDLVFIDPMGTGYSDSEKEWYKQVCYGVEGDLFSCNEFIRVFCVHFNKWNNPKYLMGASYGTLRVCGLADRLAKEGIYVNGLILCGCVIDFTTVFGDRDQALSDCLLIPTLAATAWYHGRIMQENTVEEVVEYARGFISEQSAPFMFQPSRLNAAEIKEYYQNLANLIGLPLNTVRRYGSRIDEPIYTQEFMASERKVIGGLDSRCIGDVSSISGEYPEDPSYRNFRPAIYPSFMNYLQTELEMTAHALPYKTFNNDAFYRWNWGTYDTCGLPNFLQRLRKTLIVNPTMKVFVGSGYYDIRTPFGAVEYSIDHLDLPPEYRKNFQLEYYKAGHALFFDKDSLQKFSVDLHEFYDVLQ